MLLTQYLTATPTLEIGGAASISTGVVASDQDAVTFTCIYTYDTDLTKPTVTWVTTKTSGVTGAINTGANNEDAATTAPVSCSFLWYFSIDTLSCLPLENKRMFE